MIEFKFQIPVYKTWVAVLVEPTDKEFEDFSKKNCNGGLVSNKNAAATTYVNGRSIAVVFNDYNTGTLVHESFHVCQSIFEGINEFNISTSKSEEPFAYLLEFVATKIESLIQKHKK